MHPLLERNRDALIALCRKYHVQRLEVFGSAAVGPFDEQHSDVDLLVAFEPVSAMGPADQYFGLLADAELVLGRRVDLVEDEAVRSPHFRRAINAQRQELYVRPYRQAS